MINNLTTIKTSSFIVKEKSVILTLLLDLDFDEMEDLLKPELLDKIAKSYYCDDWKKFKEKIKAWR